MGKEELKKELHQLIDAIDDEELLGVVKEDIVACQKAGTGFDDLSELTSGEKAALEELANEDSRKDAISFEEYQGEMKLWRSTL